MIDTHLNTGVAEYNVSQGQVFSCTVKCLEVLDNLIDLGVLEVVDEGTPERKKLPVFYPDDTPLLDSSGGVIPLSGGLDGVLEQEP